MTVPRSLQLPGPEYSEEEERQFRRELEDYLLNISSDIEGAQTRLGTVSSQATKRSLLSTIPVGITEVPTAPPSYYCGSKSIGSGATTVTINGVTWATQPGTWTANLSSLWAEDGTTGNIVYTGTDTRKFFVSYSLTLDFVGSGSIYASNTSITGKIEKIPSGGSVGDVAGSIGESGRAYYLTAFGAYYFLCHVSRGTIVSVAENDSLNFRYGFGNRFNASGTYTATLKQTGDTNYTGTVKGVTLNIVPAEAAT